jgi:hypothetical protein
MKKKSAAVEVLTSKGARDQAGRFLPGHPFGAATHFQPNVSGNPNGLPGYSRSRREFEANFYAALMGEGSPAEAAKLLWDCARAKEPWAVQLLLSRIAPHEARLRITPETNGNATYDLSRLTDRELDLFIELAGRARDAASDAAPRLIEGGESTTEIP